MLIQLLARIVRLFKRLNCALRDHDWFTLTRYPYHAQMCRRCGRTESKWFGEPDVETFILKETSYNYGPLEVAEGMLELAKGCKELYPQSGHMVDEYIKRVQDHIKDLKGENDA